MMIVPEKTVNYRVYRNGVQYMGMATVDLPQLQYMTASISGSGIAGEVDTPVTGHFQSMSTTLHFRTTTEASMTLLTPQPHELDLRASIDANNPATGLRFRQAVRLWIKGVPKSNNPGKFEPGTTMDNDVELEVLAMGLWIDGVEQCYIDKMNYICRVDGVDYLADARVAEGIGG